MNNEKGCHEKGSLFLCVCNEVLRGSAKCKELFFGKGGVQGDMLYFIQRDEAHFHLLVVAVRAEAAIRQITVYQIIEAQMMHLPPVKAPEALFCPQ